MSRVQKMFCGKSRTKSEFKEECDINRVMARFQNTGIVEHVAKRPPRFGNAIGLPDFHQAQQIVVEAREAFAALPAEVRKRFQNDPGSFADFATDPANLEDLRKWGLAHPLETAEPAEPAEAPGGAPGGPQGAPDGGGAAGSS